ncbi:MAG TPA: PBP1A family penicillin-binding protein [Candidatus Saccharimonadia bacterium]|nr:PBP1A family penicillin-binding protein [Candidatus Saccharimonadia bacterium]
MAKSKPKPRKSPRGLFYEALPVAQPSQLGLSDAGQQLRDALQTLGELWQTLREQSGPVSRAWSAWLIRTGLATSATLGQWARAGIVATRYAGDATRTYAPAAVADAGVFAGRVRRRLGDRRARALYLSLAAGALFGLVAVTAVTATNTLRSYAQDISSPGALLDKKKTGITILDRNNQVLYQGYGAQSNTPVQLGDIPPTLKNATLAAEDPSFYEHPGFSWRGTIRAAVTDLTHQNRAEGGSTLTQQLIKNALLTSDKKFQRKYQELLLAMELEQRYSKDDILLMYLNDTYYGQGSSGVEAASQTYFHKPVSQLTLGESALLAGLPLGPSRLDPNVNLDAALGRRDYVLTRLAELGKITPAEATAAKAQPLALADSPGASPNALIVYAKPIIIRAPHFVFYVLDQLRSKYGSDAVENGGLTVHTTLDLTKQDLAQQTIQTQISKLGSHHVTNGGLISIEPSTGNIVAMVGSVDYNAPGFGNVNVTLSQLQPGSSFKPIAYATAFKKGYTGATHVDDTPMSVPNGDGTLYVPQNYDLKFRGSVSLRQALANSLNIPAIKVLQFAGIHDTIQTAHDMGITTLQDESRFGLALVLGGGEVRPLDMATVYATFANNGTKVEPRAILKVQNRYGQDITKPANTTPQAVLDPRIAYMITNILSDNPARTPEFGPNSPLKLSRPTAAKTGTTNDFRDNWTVGYTPQLATAVWVGNNDHTPMNNVDGITGAAPIWGTFMEAALADQPVVDFSIPAGIGTAKVCAADGGLANPWDAGYTEIFMTSAMPTKPCASRAPQVDIPPTPASPTAPTIPLLTLPNLPPIILPHTKPFLNPFQ